MGALINTLGTQILKYYFNATLFTGRVANLRNDRPTNDPRGDGSPIQVYFNDPNYTLYDIVTTLQHPLSQRPDNLIFLPDQPFTMYNVQTPCPNLEMRWTYFLNTNNPGVLQKNTHDQLKAAISKGLHGNYQYLQFDCVDGTGLNPAQTVSSADMSLGSGNKYLMIVLQTPPMPQNTPVPLCPQ